jgi:hypothetical protein
MRRQKTPPSTARNHRRRQTRPWCGAGRGIRSYVSEIPWQRYCGASSNITPTYLGLSARACLSLGVRYGMCEYTAIRILHSRDPAGQTPAL